MSKKKLPTVEGYDHRVADAFGFSPMQLAANGNGVVLDEPFRIFGKPIVSFLSRTQKSKPTVDEYGSNHLQHVCGRIHVRREVVYDLAEGPRSTPATRVRYQMQIEGKLPIFQITEKQANTLQDKRMYRIYYVYESESFRPQYRITSVERISQSCD